MAAALALAETLEAKEGQFPPELLLTDEHNYQETENYNEAPQQAEQNVNVRCEALFARSSETFSKLGKFTLRQEIGRVRLMTGDVVGIDYAGGVFKAINLANFPKPDPTSEEEPITESEWLENQTAERLIWVIALASVAQKAKTKARSPDPKKQEEVEEAQRVADYDKPLIEIANEATDLIFELRKPKTPAEVISEIETLLNELIEKESRIFEARKLLSEVVYDDAKEAEGRFEHSLHRKQRMQAALFNIKQKRIASAT